MSDHDEAQPAAAELTPKEHDHPPETRWWRGWAKANPVLDQLFRQQPPGLRGRITEVRVRRDEDGAHAIQFAYLPDPPKA